MDTVSGLNRLQRINMGSAQAGVGFQCLSVLIRIRRSSVITSVAALRATVLRLNGGSRGCAPLSCNGEGVYAESYV